MTTEGEGLQLTGKFPVLLSSIRQMPDDAELLAVSDANESLLKASLILHEIPDLDDHDPVSAELRRQDIKINFLLDMMGELLSKNDIIPPPQEITLTATRFQCRIDNGAKAGDLMEIGVFIEPATPRPLKLFGAVSAVENNVVTVELEGLMQPVQDLLEKIIFRQHRRMVALKKQGTSDT